MNTFTLLENIMEVIRGDSTLKAWITSTYGGQIKCYTGFNNEKPPGEADCPLIALWPEGEEKGDGVEEGVHIIRMRLEIKQADITTVADADGTWIKYKGVEELITLRHKAIDAIVGNFPTVGLKWLKFESKLETVENFPIFWADITMEFLDHHNILSSIYT